MILGSTGFVGRNLVKSLKKNYYLIKISKSNGINLLNLQKIKKKIKETNPNIIINCAANQGSVHYVIKKTADLAYENMTMTLNIYKAIQETKTKPTIINLLANCSYSGSSKIQKEKNWWDGQPHHTALSFGFSRRLIYVLSEAYKLQYGVKSINFIIPGVYGPGNHLENDKLHALDGMILRMIKAKKNRSKSFEIWGSGSPKREWCYIEDLIKFIKMLIKEQKEIIFPINLGQKKGYSIKFLAKTIAKKIKYNGSLIFNKKFPDGALIKILDNNLFKKKYPKFKFTSIEKGIHKSVKYYNKVI